jgi:hypothetical protein
MPPTRPSRAIRLPFALGLAVVAAAASADTVVVGPVPGSPALSGLRLLNRLAAITDASSSRPYVLKLEPGVYDLRNRTLAMRAFVDVEGSGEGVTLVRGSADGTGTIAGAPHAELRSLTVESRSPSAAIALRNSASGFRASHVTCIASTGGQAAAIVQDATDDVVLRSVTASATGDDATGVASRGGRMTDVVARATATDLAYAVFNAASGGELVNVIAEAESGRFAGGIRNEGGAPTLRNVRASARGDSMAEGIVNGAGSGARIFGGVVLAVAGSDFAVGVSNESSSAVLSDLDVTARGDTSAFGISNQFSGTPSLLGGTVRAEAGGNGIGVLTDGGVAATVERSTVSGDGFSVANGFGAAATVTRVGASRLDGPTRAGSGTLRCVESYGGAFAPLGSSCLPVP